MRLRDWLKRQRRTDRWINELDQALEHPAPQEYEPNAAVLHSYYVQLSDLVGDAAARLLTLSWLGHNGISVSTHRDRADSPYQDELRMTASEDIFGLVCLFDDLRPDVSVSRDTLRGLSFDIRSAIQMAVRRAASVHLGSAEHRFATTIRTRELLSDTRLPGLTVRQIEADPLAAEWRAEQLFQVQADNVLSAAEIRSLAANEPIPMTLPLVQWSRDYLDHPRYGSEEGFYGVLRAAIAERELDIELTDAPDYVYQYRMSVLDGKRPVRPPGLSVLPPFSAVRYSSPEVLIVPWYPANLGHPIMAWFADHAADLSTSYPALFAQVKRALATVANIRYQKQDEKQRIAEGAARLLNDTLDRIRRSVPSVPEVLSREIYADESFRLLSR